MKKITLQNVKMFNENLRYESPEDIISFVRSLYNKAIVSTSFGTYSSSLLHAVTQQIKDVPVIWCDTGYNTPATYAQVTLLKNKLELNLDIFTPKYTTAYITHALGEPNLQNANHEQISHLVKIEPFVKALNKYQPEIWFSNVRKEQTTHRNHLNILSFSKEGILKVSPFYHFSEEELLAYMSKYELPIVHDYYDPIKATPHRECGIHFT